MLRFLCVLCASACIVENFEIFRIVMALMVKWDGRLWKGRAEDGKL